MIDHPNKKLRVIDWGVSEYYLYGAEYNFKVGTRFFRGPEQLLNYPYYHYSVDMWAVGCIMGELIF